MSSPFSLRPWPTGDKKPKNLGEFIARINSERGGFRNVTEVQLREEIRDQEEGRLDNDSLAGESDSDEAEDDKKKTIQATRDEFMRNIELAHQSSMLCLDFVSLLLSKDAPVHAGSTLSTDLRDLVGIGTLGATKLKDSNITQTRINDDLAVATGWRVMGINKMVDSVVAAAERLEKEISLETKYWADVLAVSENGWSVSALPYEPHTLGVRFGFAEAAPEYVNNSIAPLRRNDDGTVRLDHGRVGGGSQRIRVVIEKNDSIVGRSSLPRRTPDASPLQDRVLEARNTIFSQELWYEINREARTLLSYGVRSDGSCVTYEIDTKTKLILTLEELGEPEVPDKSPENKAAEAVALGLHFLLSHAHRGNYNRRSQVHLASSTRDTYYILRPIIARFKYDAACSTLVFFLTELAATLNRAGVYTVSFTHSIPPITSQLSLQGSRGIAKSEVLMHNMMQNIEISADFTITPEARIYIRGKAFMNKFVRMPFLIQVPDQPKGPPNPLKDSYPPFAEDPHYPNVDEAIRYISQATIRALSEKYAALANLEWSETVQGAAIMDRTDREARIEVLGKERPVLSLTVDGKNVQSRQWAWGVGEFQEKLEDRIVKFFQENSTY